MPLQLSQKTKDDLAKIGFPDGPIYIASPYTHKDPKVMQERYEYAMAVGAYMATLGHICFEPINSCHVMSTQYDLPKGYEFWKKRDRAMIGASGSVLVLQLPGWVTSVGVDDEIGHAKNLELPVYYTPIYAKSIPASQQGPESGGTKYDAGKLRYSLIPCFAYDLITDNWYGLHLEDVHTEGLRSCLIAFWAGRDIRTLMRAGETAIRLLNPKSGDACTGEVASLLVQIMEMGAEKYGDENWLKGMNWSRSFSAAMRHLEAHDSGQLIDDESGLPHLAHALTNILFLITYEQKGIGTDDRPTY